MIGVGCALNFCLFWGLVLGGSLMAQKHAHSAWAGAGWGVLAWLASMSTYLVWAFIDDFIKHRKRSRREDGDAGLLWFTLAIYACFAVTVPLALLIARRLFV